MYKYSLLLPLMFALNAVAATGDKDPNLVYRWVDSKGNVHFSQLPPPGQKADAVQIEAPEPSSTPVPVQAVAQTDQPSAHDDQLAQLQQQLKSACKQAKENLATLTTFDRVRQVDANGEYKMLSEEEKAVQIAQYQKQIKEACKE